MKKLAVNLGLMTVFFSSFLFFSPMAHAATPPDNCFNFSSGVINLYYNNEDDNAANPACPKDVDIPSTIAGVPVTSIGGSAFGNKQLIAVTIPNTVTDIGSSAFSNNQISSLSLPNSVITIGSGAFVDNQLSSVTIPNSLTTLSNSVFSSNEITNLTIPSSITTIEVGAFAYNRLSSLTIPDTVVSIEGSAFYQNQLTSVILGGGITSIEAGTFDFNQLASITIPANITTIDPAAFRLQGVDTAAFAGGDYSSLMEIYYTRLYTADPTNPENFQDSQQTYAESALGSDVNGDGDLLDNIPIGGHLINPAQATVTYKNTAGATLAPTITITGSGGLHSYIASDNDTQDLSRYFRLRESRPFTAPKITGYSKVTPASPYNIILVDANTNVNFVYSSPSDKVPLAPTTGIYKSTTNGIYFTSVIVGLIILLVSVRYLLQIYNK